jgi:DNA repair ATPase RecN
MRRITIIGVLLCVAYFLLGLVAVQVELLDQNTYNQYASVVGGLASILGLLAFAQPRLTTSDLQQVEADALKQVSQAVGELEQRKGELAETGKEIDALELRKAEMRIIAKKVSLGQYLNDKRERLQEELISLVSNAPFEPLIKEIAQVDQKLSEIEEELEGRDEDVQVILDAIEEVGAHDRYSRLTSSERNFLKSFLAIDRFLEALTKGLAQSLKVSIKGNR